MKQTMNTKNELRPMLYLFLGLTAYNIAFDWLFNRLGGPTMAWEGGILTALTWVWILRRFNIPKPEPTKLTAKDLLAILRDAQSADLTAMKMASIVNRSGHQITGFVACHPETHERCIVEMSACRWLTNGEMWWLMHVSESPFNDSSADTARK